MTVRCGRVTGLDVDPPAFVGESLRLNNGDVSPVRVAIFNEIPLETGLAQTV